MNPTIKALKVKTDGQIEAIEIERDKIFETVREAVGGWVEIVRYLKAPAQELVMTVNEEGIMMQLPINRIASQLYRGPRIVGNAVILREGFNEDGEMDFISLTDQDIESFTNHFLRDNART
jgi:hypothetical protein